MVETVESIAIAVWGGVVAYYWELFGYYLFFKWYKTRKTFNLANGLFFLSLAIGRVFYVIYDFYINELFWWKLGTFFQWIGLAVLSFTIGMLLIKSINPESFIARNKLFVYVLMLLIPFGIGVSILALPEEYIAILRFVVLTILAPIYAILIPILYFYLGFKMTGKFRTGSLFQGVGFLILYAGRVINAQISASVILPLLGETVALLLPPCLVIIALMFIVFGIQVMPD